MKRKHDASVSLLCDRLAEGGDVELMSMNRIVDSVANIVGDTMPLPLPFRGWAQMRRGTANKKLIENSINHMFETHLNMPNPRHVVRRIGAGRVDTAASYTKAEVAEWLWTIVVEYIDAKILSVLPRTRSLRTAKSGKSNYHVDAEDGRGWPRSDDEWQRGASLVALWLDDAGQLLDNVPVDVVVAYIRDAVVHSTGVTIDAAMLQEHVSPVMLHIAPSIFLAKTLVRSSIIAEFIGEALAVEARRRQFESDWAVSLTIDDSLLVRVSQELADNRKLIVTAKQGKDIDAIRAVLGRSLVIDPSGIQRGVNLRSQTTLASRVKQYQNLVGMVAANATVSANCRLSGFYRALGGNPDAIEEAIAHLGKCCNNRELRELAINADDCLDMIARDDFSKACTRLDMPP